MAPTVKIPSGFAEAIQAIHTRVPEDLREPKVGIVCGSGLSGLVASIRNSVLVPYSELPGFGTSTGKPASRDLVDLFLLGVVG